MARPLLKILAIAGLLACGEKNDSAKLSQLSLMPANTPMRSECLGLDTTRNQSIAVDWDDQTPLRVCLIQQSDGALAFDIRLRVNAPEMHRQAVNIELKSSNDRSSSGVFPLVWNPFNGVYELQLSQGCLVGTPGGCAMTAPIAMRRLFATLPHAEGHWRPDVKMTISLVPTGDVKTPNDNPRFTFLWNTRETRDSDKSVN